VPEATIRTEYLRVAFKQNSNAPWAAAKAHRERDWLMILVCFWHGLKASECIFPARCDADGY